MPNETDLAHLRQIYACIIQGYATLVYNKRVIFVRHFSPIEQAAVDEEYLKIYSHAKKSGLPSEADRLKELLDQKEWTGDDEADLENTKFYLSNLQSTKRAESLPSRMEDLNRQIQEAENRLRENTRRRLELIGLTAESFAYQKLNEIYIYKSFYKDKDFADPFFSEEEYDEFERSEIAQLVKLYNERIQDFSDRNIKRVALAPFFQNYFFLCDDNVFNFYGKPIVSLTFYQSELASYAKYFKSILSSENKPPSHIMDDPDKLIDWATANRNSRKFIDQQSKAQGEGSAMSIVGATTADLEQLGLKQPKAKSIQDAAKGKKGLTMQELMEFSGVK